MIVVTLHLKANPEKRWDVLKSIHALIGPTSVQTGCLHCAFYSNTRNDDELILLEKWATYKDLEKHIHSDEFQKILAIMEVVSRPPEINFYETDSIKGMDFVEEILGE
jgi:quinol monooxygenase YgiN